MTAIFTTLTKQVPDTLERGDDWRTAGACRETDPEIFFAVGEGPEALQQTDDAKAVCNACPVKDICRDWAVGTRQEHGVWGGMTAKERHNLRRREARATASDTELKQLAAALLAEHSVPVGDHREWRGPTSIRIKGIVTTAKRIAWINQHGARPTAALLVACGHPPCILPAHMELQSAGTPATVTPEEAADHRADIFNSRSVDVGNGHREWRFSEPVTVGGATYTARQLAWAVAYEDRPAGVLTVTCGHKGCINPDHLHDRGTVAPAVCGTRGGYRKHRRNKEKACDPCRQANNDADRRLRNTGTTKPKPEPEPEQAAEESRRPAGIARCGTTDGYKAHKQWQEQPCPSCQDAEREAIEAPSHPTCGTRSGYDIHTTRGEAPCRPCTEARARTEWLLRQPAA